MTFDAKFSTRLIEQFSSSAVLFRLSLRSGAKCLKLEMPLLRQMLLLLLLCKEI